uniref:Uncharacterized protein n=1 Tax=Panagrolaimus sp. PS1159 TaxID=55785 RepID=A0AC35FVD2_9BILA
MYFKSILCLFVAFFAVSHAYTYAPTLWQAYRELSPFLLPDTDALSSYCSAILEENPIFSTNNSSRFSTLIPSYFRRFLKE